MKKTISLILSVILSLSLLSGCKSSDSDTVNIKDIKLYPVTVGNVRIEEAPKRVVCLSSTLYALSAELGYEDQIIAVSEGISLPEGSKIKTVSASVSSFDVSAIKELKPDCVMLESSISVEDASLLSKEGIQLVVLMPAKNYDELSQLYKSVGSLYGGSLSRQYKDKKIVDDSGNEAAPDTGESKAAKYFKKSIDDTIEKYSSNIKADPKDILYISSLEDGYIAGSKTIEADIMGLIGKSITGVITAGPSDSSLNSPEGYYKFDETISQLSPDHIVLPSPGTLEALQQNPVFAEMDAVKNGNVIVLPETAFRLQDGKHMSEILTRILSTIYPEGSSSAE